MTTDLAERAWLGLNALAAQLGGRLDGAALDGPVVLATPHGRWPLTVRVRSQVLEASAPSTPSDAVEVVVADRITSGARQALDAQGSSWLDLRGRARLVGPGLLVDTDVDTTWARRPPAAPVDPVAGRGPLAVAYWLCEHPGEAMSPTRHAVDLGMAPSTVSTSLARLREAGLVDDDRRGLQPDLFDQLAAAWRPVWTWLASVPESLDGAVLTGDRAAAALGAPVVVGPAAPRELLVPGPVAITVAARRYGTAAPGAGVAAVAVAPVAAATREAGASDGWPLAPTLAVALGLGHDRARGREVLAAWRPEESAGVWS